MLPYNIYKFEKINIEKNELDECILYKCDENLYEDIKIDNFIVLEREPNIAVLKKPKIAYLVTAVDNNIITIQSDQNPPKELDINKFTREIALNKNKEKVKKLLGENVDINPNGTQSVPKKTFFSNINPFNLMNKKGGKRTKKSNKRSKKSNLKKRKHTRRSSK